MSRAAEFGGRAARHVAWRARRAATWTVDRFRAGDRTVVMTPPAGLRFGNWLYLWLDAHQRTAAGVPTLVLEAPGMASWLDEFPVLTTLAIERERMRFHDRREWNEDSWAQRFGVDFTRPTLDAFIAEALAPSLTPDTTGSLVLNVRRGDYYSNPGLRERYGFDVLGYLTAALQAAGDAPAALVVSDDPAWCRQHLDALIREHASSVEYAEPGAAANFRAIAQASRLIGTNSTFSYWGGYISGVLHEAPQIIMPRFHARLPSGTDAYQLDPTWTVIEGFH